MLQIQRARFFSTVFLGNGIYDELVGRTFLRIFFVSALSRMADFMLQYDYVCLCLSARVCLNMDFSLISSLLKLCFSLLYEKFEHIL